ncbi:DUF1798 family protein [Halobacillus locisalis]|uniref:DUF1798 family protein n=1 Tax=Halobacillus locisalis TaxID=220753 RepID=A0A838CPW1_9BACI|nr:DUF1798 family protein [Halobacillus locisalis]MBA2173913.1 DUF1798 family protein [Halobacillus locisalis]
MPLVKLTEQLKTLIDERHHHFINTEGPIDKSDRSFFEQVKKETSPMFEMNLSWRDEAEAFVKDRRASVHPNQVKSTHENIDMIILHSYYLDVDLKRFKELHQSAHYVLDMILDDSKE